MHYVFKAGLFGDQISTCNALGACYIKNDAPVGMDLVVTVTLLNMMTGKSEVIVAHEAAMEAGAGAVQWFCPGGGNTTSASPAGDHMTSSHASCGHNLI